MSIRSSKHPQLYSLVNLLFKFPKNISSLKVERKRVWISFALLFAGLLLTFIAALIQKADVEKDARNEFEFVCNELQSKISSRLHSQAQLLRSQAALFELKQNITREDWHNSYIRQLTDINLPGIQGIGYQVIIPPKELALHEKNIRKEGFPEYSVKPAGKRDIYTSIIYIEPFSGRNLRAFGYDVFLEPIRGAAMAKARDNNAASLSGKITLLQETDSDIQAGTIIYVPVYKKGMPTETIEHRREAIQGWVYSAYRMDDLMAGIIGANRNILEKNLRLEVFDNSSYNQDALLYDSKKVTGKGSISRSLFTIKTISYFNDRQWHLRFTRYDSGVSRLDYGKVWFIAIGGTCVTILLFVLYLSLIFTNIRAKKLAEELTLELSESEALFRNMADTAPVFIWTSGTDAKCNYFNKVWLDFTGRAMEQELGNGWTEGVHPDDLQKCLEIYLGSFNARQEFRTEYRLRNSDGEYRWIMDVGIPRFTQNGIFLGYIGSCMDITERKMAEENLSNEQRLLRTIIDSIPVAIYVKDTESKKIIANLAEVQLSGQDSEDEVIGKTDFDLYKESEAKRYYDEDQTVIQSGVPLLELESRLIDKESQIHWLLGSKVPLRNAQGQITGIVGINQDISKRKQAEDLVKQIRQNYETFFDTIDELLFVLDEQGIIIHFNSAVINRLGYTREELIGNSVLMVHPPERRDEAGRIVGEMLSGVTDFCPIPLITKMGVYIPVETRVTAGRWNGQPAIFGVTKDISQIMLSEEKFSKVFYLNPSACGLSDLVTGEYIEVNNAFCSLLGYEKAEVIGKTAIELGILSIEARNNIFQQSKGSTVNRIESELITKDGKVKNVLLSAENIYIQEKQLRYTVVHDITERKQAEEDLQKINQKWEAMVLASPDGIGLLSLDGKLQLASDKLLEMHGYEHINDIIGKSSFDFIDSSNYEFFKENIRKLCNGQSQINIKEYIGIKKDGSRFYFDINSTLLRDANGNPESILFVERDITDRKHAEEALKASEAKLSAVVANISDVIVIMDANATVKYTSPNIKKLFGWDSKDTGQNGWLKIHPDDIERMQGEFYSLLEKDNSVKTLEFRYKCKDGNFKPIELTGTNLTKDPVIGGVLMNFHDITERKEAEEKIKQANIDLEKSNSEKDKFFSIIAHDLRSPFTGLIGLSEILATESGELSSAEIEQFSNSLHKSILNINKLIENLLEWAQVQRGTISCTPEELDLSDIFSHCIASIEHRALQKRVTIINEIPENRKVVADKMMITTILRNLLSNAVKFTKKSGKIIGTAKEQKDGIVISVSDTGIGIPAGIVEKLFKLGENVGTTGTDDEPSTGLGLLLCREFVEKHNGKIWVESCPGEGSTFFFTIPKNI